VEGDPYYVCQRCTACCKWPGDVKVTAEEVDRIAQFMGMAVDDFIDQFTRLRTKRNGLSIIEKPNHECVMLEDGGCKINAVKPQQCRDFPNRWNFPGWEKVCEARPIYGEEARKKWAES